MWTRPACLAKTPSQLQFLKGAQVQPCAPETASHLRGSIFMNQCVQAVMSTFIDEMLSTCVAGIVRCLSSAASAGLLGGLSGPPSLMQPRRSRSPPSSRTGRQPPAASPSQSNVYSPPMSLANPQAVATASGSSMQLQTDMQGVQNTFTGHLEDHAASRVAGMLSSTDISSNLDLPQASHPMSHLQNGWAGRMQLPQMSHPMSEPTGSMQNGSAGSMPLPGTAPLTTPMWVQRASNVSPYSSGRPV